MLYNSLNRFESNETTIVSWAHHHYQVTLILAVTPWNVNRTSKAQNLHADLIISPRAFGTLLLGIYVSQEPFLKVQLILMLPNAPGYFECTCSIQARNQRSALMKWTSEISLIFSEISLVETVRNMSPVPIR